MYPPCFSTISLARARPRGLIYQFYNLIPVLTVEENMTLPCELDGRKPDRGLVREQGCGKNNAHQSHRRAPLVLLQ